MKMEKFLNDQNSPRYNQLLLGLAGVKCLADLEEIDDAFLDDVQNQVRVDGFRSEVDFSLPGSRQNRLNYFGVDLINREQFSFRLLERKKLLKSPEALKKMREDKMLA